MPYKLYKKAVKVYVEDEYNVIEEEIYSISYPDKPAELSECDDEDTGERLTPEGSADKGPEEHKEPTIMRRLMKKNGSFSGKVVLSPADPKFTYAMVEERFHKAEMLFLDSAQTSKYDFPSSDPNHPRRIKSKVCELQ